jgi:hypothetical protein
MMQGAVLFMLLLRWSGGPMARTGKDGKSDGEDDICWKLWSETRAPNRGTRSY